MRERQMKRKYAKAKERARQHRYEKIKVMEMLLSGHGAKWDERLECFIVRYFQRHATPGTNGALGIDGVYRKTRFIDIDGNEIPNPRDFCAADPNMEQYQKDIARFTNTGN